MMDLEKQEKIKNLFEVRNYYREQLDHANMKLAQAEQEINFYCDILQDVGADLEKLGVDPLAD